MQKREQQGTKQKRKARKGNKNKKQLENIGKNKDKIQETSGNIKTKIYPISNAKTGTTGNKTKEKSKKRKKNKKQLENIGKNKDKIQETSGNIKTKIYPISNAKTGTTGNKTKEKNKKRKNNKKTSHHNNNNNNNNNNNQNVRFNPLRQFSLPKTCPLRAHLSLNFNEATTGDLTGVKFENKSKTTRPRSLTPTIAASARLVRLNLAAEDCMSPGHGGSICQGMTKHSKRNTKNISPQLT